MYFRRRKNSVQVFAPRGYDCQKKRTITRYLGTIFLSPVRPDTKLLCSLLDDEKEELNQYLEKLIAEELTDSQLHNEEQFLFFLSSSLKCLEKIRANGSIQKTETIREAKNFLREIDSHLNWLTRQKKKTTALELFNGDEQ